MSAIFASCPQRPLLCNDDSTASFSAKHTTHILNRAPLPHNQVITNNLSYALLYNIKLPRLVKRVFNKLVHWFVYVIFVSALVEFNLAIHSSSFLHEHSYIQNLSHRFIQTCHCLSLEQTCSE